jgi:dTMP kinase
MHAAACDNLQPDLTLLLLPSLESSLKRARRRNQRHVEKQGTDENRFERESDEFYRRIYEKYREIAVREPQRVVILDRNDSIEEIAREIHSIVTKKMISAERSVVASTLKA